MKVTKVSVAEKIRELEKLIASLETWVPGSEFSENVFSIDYSKTFGLIQNLEQRDLQIKFHKENLEIMRTNMPVEKRYFLSEIIEKDNIIIKGKNILILAPVGSGKTTFIDKIIQNNPNEEYLMLVSNTALKDSISPPDTESKKRKGNRTFTTRHKYIYGEGSHRVHVMSYAEFGAKVRHEDNFTEKFKTIFCDEIHSLPNYQKINDSTNLSHAMQKLFKEYEDKTIYYFTATDEYLEREKKNFPTFFKNLKKYDFRNNSEIQRYMPLSEYKFYHIEQIRQHLRARHETFKYFGYKSMAFSRTITGQKRIAEIAKEEGFNPLVLWSVNNTNSETKMTDEQLKARDYLLSEGVIPEPYDFLIINSAMQEGWDLHDLKVKLVIMNTLSETEKIQATGRLRNDIDVLAYKVTPDTNLNNDKPIDIPEEYLDVYLTKAKKEELSERLNIINSKGVPAKWKKVNEILKDMGNEYSITDTLKNIDGKRTRVTIISEKKNYE